MPQQHIRFAHLPHPASRDGHGSAAGLGTRIAWAVQGRGPALLRAAHWMTHVGQDPQSPVWQPWLDRLGQDFRLLRFDERGCGMSGPDDTPLTLDTAVEELKAVADDAGLDRLALLGISGRGPAAIAFAARYPERVSHLMLLGAYSRGPLAGQASEQARAWVDATARLIELGWGRDGSPEQQFFTATLIPDGTRAQVQAMNEQQRLCCGPARAATLLRARVALDVEQLLPQVRCPTLVMHMQHDATVAAENGRALAASIAGARFVELPGRNHVPLAGEPAFERMCQAMAAFVTAPAAVSGPAGFSARERALLHLVAAGRDNLQIGAELGLADKTVRNTLSRLYARLGVAGRPQAVVRARELGFG